MIKKILIITLTTLIAVSGFLTGFFSVGVISVYASVDDDSIYVPLRDPSDAVTAFQAYCKSRDLTIEGSLTDAVTTFTTGAFNSACNEIGINITELQAEIKAEYDSSGKPVKFLFTSSGVMAMNRVFAQFLQDNDLAVGDNVNDENIYSGEYFVDFDGNACLVFVTSTLFQGLNNDNYITAYGTPYKYNGIQIANMYPSASTITFNLLQNQSRTVNINSTTLGGYTFVYVNNNNSYRAHSISGDKPCDGYPAIIKTTSNRYYFGFYSRYDSFDKINYTLDKIEEIRRTDITPSVTVANVIITTNNNTINNNNYEGDTIINNEGDIINNYPDPEPSDPNDTIHNVPQSPLGPDGIQLPDIDIPNLPIGNLSEKFPFSIPWDLAAFYAMLDAEPEAPRFNGTMDLTLVQWNYDIDLSPFDSAAELCRKLQFGLFVVGLIVASRSIIRG